MQADMLSRARRRLEGQIVNVTSLKEVRDFFAAEKEGGVKLDYALVKDSDEFEKIRKDFSVQTRCLPFADGGGKVIVAKSY
jgi:hypothetical protein